MRASLKSCLGKGLSKASAAFWLLSVLVVSLGEPCWADQLSLAPLAPSSEEPDWTLGPAKAALGALAEVEVPQGYRFTDASGARVLLQRSRNPAPEGLLGILAPDSGKWWIVLSYRQLGYIEAANLDPRIDTAAVLKGVRERAESQNAVRVRQGWAPITSIDWVLQPAFDAKQHSIEWAVRVGAESEGIVNYTVRLLGRHGILDATAVQLASVAASDPVPLKQLMANVSFKPGERYSDYQRGDKLAKIGLAQLIVDDQGATASLSPFMRAGLWAGAVLFLGVIAGGVILIRRQLRTRTSAGVGGREQELNGAQFLISKIQNSTASARMRTGHHAGKNGSHNGDSLKRRRMFDYHRFYSDLILQVSSHPYVHGAAANGESLVRETNGHVPARPAMSAVNDAIVRANLELIANQTNLIEEQKRLLQEQTKLIEEKSRLLREKNQLLEKQTELFERDIL